MRVGAPDQRLWNDSTVACHGQDADLFFAERPAEVETAKGLCP